MLHRIVILKPLLLHDDLVIRAINDISAEACLMPTLPKPITFLPEGATSTNNMNNTKTENTTVQGYTKVIRLLLLSICFPMLILS